MAHEPVAWVMFVLGLAAVVIVAVVAFVKGDKSPEKAREVVTIPAKAKCADCDSEATEAQPIIVHNNEALDFVRGWFGAAPRLRVYLPEAGPDYPPVYCAPHASLAEQIARSELAAVEAKRHADLIGVESRLAHFEKVGLREKVSALVEREKP